MVKGVLLAPAEFWGGPFQPCPSNGGDSDGDGDGDGGNREP
jgi:hypothetical protein